MRSLIFSVLTGLFAISTLLVANDWPTYGYDGNRSGVSPVSLPGKLFAQWTFQSRHVPRAAWPLPGEETPRMHSDRACHVVAAGNTIFFGNNVDNHLHAHDTRTGKRKWSFAADGSVRFAPFVSEGRIYFGSDDGHIYCVDADIQVGHVKLVSGHAASTVIQSLEVIREDRKTAARR